MTLQLPIYMDNNATTRTDPRVVAAMLPFFDREYGNAASKTHVFGWKADEAVEQARTQIAELIGASAREIVFTSGATESNNLAIKGVAGMFQRHGNHIITVATEHKAVLDPCRRLAQNGFTVTVLPVDQYGRVEADDVAAAITDKTILVSVMTANNEIGTLQPVQVIGRICKERGVLFHTDAAQAVGKIPIDVEAMGIDLLSISGHKIYGPKGIGALYVRRRDPHVRLEPQIDGGGHERGMRSGTLPVPLIVALGLACRLAQEEMESEHERLKNLREKLKNGIMDGLDEVSLNGHPSQRLANNLNLSFAHVHSEAVIMAMRDVAVSSGSACTSDSVEPSHVLRAIGISEEAAHGSIRYGLGRFTTEEEVDYVTAKTIEVVKRLRAVSPSQQLASAP